MEQDKINTLSDHYQQQDDQLDDFNNDDDVLDYDEVDGRFKDRILSIIAKRAGWFTTRLSKEGSLFFFAVTRDHLVNHFYVVIKVGMLKAPKNGPKNSVPNTRSCIGWS